MGACIFENPAAQCLKNGAILGRKRLPGGLSEMANYETNGQVGRAKAAEAGLSARRWASGQSAGFCANKQSKRIR